VVVFDRLTGIILSPGKARFEERCRRIGREAQRCAEAKEPGLRWAIGAHRVRCLPDGPCVRTGASRCTARLPGRGDMLPRNGSIIRRTGINRPIGRLRFAPDRRCPVPAVYSDFYSWSRLEHIGLDDRAVFQNPVVAEFGKVEAAVGAVSDQFSNRPAGSRRLLDPVPGKTVAEV